MKSRFYPPHRSCRPLTAAKYDVVPIGITKQGLWLTDLHAEQLIKGEFVAAPAQQESARRRSGGDLVGRGAGQGRSRASCRRCPRRIRLCRLRRRAITQLPRPIRVDVIFPVLHGTFGEDGTMQGLLELADIAYVGSGVLGSAAGMDKDIMKRLFCDSRLPLVKHLTVLRSEWERQPKKIEKAVDSALKYPVFVKPANLGSSVGISKAHDVERACRRP